MFNILVDTCVWLDLAKDPDQKGLLNVIEELIELGELQLIVPETVLVEFNRNKERIIKESTQSLSAVFKRAKDAVSKFGDDRDKQQVLRHLNSIDHKLPQMGEAVSDTLIHIHKLLETGVRLKATQEIIILAAQRAIEKKAPFHRGKNSFNDAILIETYVSVTQKRTAGYRFAFVTHNKSDFSSQAGNERNPHEDFSGFFSKRRSLYFIKLSEAIHRVRPDLVSDLMMQQELNFESRTLAEILDAEKELEDKVWYNRHKNLAYKIDMGKVRIVPKEEFELDFSNKTVVDEIWKGAILSAKKLEKHYGKENLGPWDDFEWGMINGKLSALRWVMGDDWDELYT